MTAGRQLLSLLSSAILIFGVAGSSLAQQVEDQPQSLYFVTIAINEIGEQGVYAALDTPEGFFLDAQAFAPLGLTPPNTPPRAYRTFSLLPLGAVPSLSYEFDGRRMHLDISCGAACFPHKDVGDRWQYAPADPPSRDVAHKVSRELCVTAK